MKKILAFTFATIFGLTAFAQKPDEVAKFNTEKHSFGVIKQNIPARYEFSFTNIGTTPLIVESATAGCGCTTPEKPEEPIMPGKTGVIKVQYNAAAVTPFTKQVFVKFVGIAEQKVLTIEGEVKDEAGYAEYAKNNKVEEKKDEKKKETATPVVAAKKKKKKCAKC